jgi:RNA polymerase sigma-70 factor (ECF subfamily)
MEEAVRPHAGQADRSLAWANDTEVVSACVQGAPEAFQELLARYRKKALALAYQMLGNSEDAEDVAQEAFVKVFQALRGFRGQAAFSTWLYRIVANLCLARIRARRPCARLDEEAAAGAEEVSSGQVAEALVTRQVLAKLNPGLRAVLLLREQGELSYQEIAAALGLPLGTVRSRLSKARLTFREIWTEFLEGREKEP